MYRLAIWYDDVRGQSCCEYLEGSDSVIRRVTELGARRRSVDGVPYALDLIRDDGTIWDDPSRLERLSVGIGDGEWVLFYYPAEKTPNAKLLASYGNPNAVGEVLFDFGSQTPVSRKYLVPRELAIETIRSWVDYGELGDFVPWTSNIFLH